MYLWITAIALYSALYNELVQHYNFYNTGHWNWILSGFQSVFYFVSDQFLLKFNFKVWNEKKNAAFEFWWRCRIFFDVHLFVFCPKILRKHLSKKLLFPFLPSLKSYETFLLIDSAKKLICSFFFLIFSGLYE